MTVIAGIKTSNTIEDVRNENKDIPPTNRFFIPFIILVEYPKLNRYMVKYLHPDTELNYIFGIKVGTNHVPATVIEKLFS